MSEEYLDVVDEFNQVTGRERRSVVHRTGVWHRGVHVFLFTPDGRLLVQRRSQTRDTFPGALDCTVSEHLKPGESYEHGAMRGLREELGLEHVALRRCLRFSMSYGPNDNMVSELYEGMYRGEPLTVDPVEIERTAFHAPTELVQMMARDLGPFTSWFRQLLRWYTGEPTTMRILGAEATLDLYAGLAERYDRFFDRFDQQDPVVAEFFRKLFADHAVQRVLDCACGTGHDLVLFHSLGREVVGSDVSPSMLAQARKNLAAIGLELPLVEADYRKLPEHFDRHFDAVVCLSTSIAHMPNKVEAVRAFHSMRRVLRDGGILVLTQGTTDRQWREKPRFLLAADKPELTRLFVIDYYGRGARYNIVDVLREEGQSTLKVWAADYRQMLLRDEQERLLHRAGFRDVEFYGSYRFEPYDRETSSRLITVAR